MRVVCELHTAGYLTAKFREGKILGRSTIDSRQSGRRENVGNFATDTLSAAAAEIAKDCNRCLLAAAAEQIMCTCGNFM